MAKKTLWDIVDGLSLNEKEKETLTKSITITVNKLKVENESLKYALKRTKSELDTILKLI